MITDLLYDFQMVSDDEMLAAVRHLVVEEHIVPEPTGAAATAALVKSGRRGSGKIVLLVSGANITTEMLRLAFARAATEEPNLSPSR